MHTSVQGASDDILNAKNMLYQHLTWDPEKTVSLCSKLALPLATPAIGVTPPVSPKSAAAADGEQGTVLAAAAQPGVCLSVAVCCSAGLVAVLYEKCCRVVVDRWPMKRTPILLITLCLTECFQHPAPAEPLVMLN
jgi:hypothetical protein